VLLSYSNAPIPLPPTSHNETHLFVFELTSPNGNFVGHLKEPPAHHMQSFHPLNLKIFCASFWGRPASTGLFKFGITPRVTTLQATTFKLGETMGNMGTGLPLYIYYIVIPTFPFLHMEEY
jgi:hypothetical protein